jgi:hypothetical protein
MTLIVDVVPVEADGVESVVRGLEIERPEVIDMI